MALLLDFFKHPGICRGYVTELMYGDKSKISSGRYINKLHNNQGRKFTPAELAKLETIRTDLLRQLSPE